MAVLAALGASVYGISRSASTGLVDLGSGHKLMPGDSLGTPPFSLTMQEDGNLVATSPVSDYLTSAPVVVWASGTEGHTGAYAQLGNDGDLVVYSRRGVPIWSSGTAGPAGGSDCLMTDQTDGVPFASGVVSGFVTGLFSIAPCYTGGGSGPTVAVVGDSITQLAQGDIGNDLAADGYRYTISAQSGWTIGMQLPAFTADLDNPAGAPSDFIVELGTDNAFAGVFGTMPSKTWGTELDKVFAEVGARCTILVNVSDAATRALRLSISPVAEGIDAKIAAEVASHPNFHLIDWNTLVAENPQWLRSDGVHPNSTGAAALGSLYATALQDYCR